MSGTRSLATLLRRSWDTVGLMVMLSAFLVASLSLSRIAAWIPRVVLALTLVLVVVQLLIEFRELPSRTPDASRPEPPVTAAVSVPATSVPARGTTIVQAALWLVGLLTAVVTLGTVVGSTLFCFAYLRWHARESRVASGIVAVALGATIQLVFGSVLQAPLLQGWLGSLVR